MLKRNCFMSNLSLRSLRGDEGPRQFTDSILENRMKYCKSLYCRDLNGHFGCVNAIEFSSDELLLASGGDDKRVLLWETQEITGFCGKLTPITMKAEHESNIFCLAFDREKMTLLSSGNDHQVVAHDLATCQARDVFRFDDAVYCISSHPESPNLFATASEDGTVKILDLRAPASEDIFSVVTDCAPFHSVMYNPVESQLLASANVRDGVQLWDVRRSNRQLLRYHCPASDTAESAMCVRWDALGCRLLAIRRRMQPMLYEIQSAVPFVRFDHPGYYNSCTMKTCSFAGVNDEYVVAGSDDFGVYVWRIDAKAAEDSLQLKSRTKLIKQATLVLKGHRSIVNQVRYSRSNHLLASSGVEKVIKLWSPWLLPDAKGDLDTVSTSTRPVYTHQEYIGMVMNTGPRMSHDYTNENVAEDPRMLAFFDSLIQRELEGGLSDSEDSDSQDEDYFLTLASVPRSRWRETLSDEVVDSDSSSDSDETSYASSLSLASLRSENGSLTNLFRAGGESSVESNLNLSPRRADDDNENDEFHRFSPFSVAYARYLSSSRPTHDVDAASDGSAAELVLAGPAELGYLPSPHGTVRNITDLVLRKRHELDAATDDACIAARKRRRLLRSSGGELPSSSSLGPRNSRLRRRHLAVFQDVADSAVAAQVEEPSPISLDELQRRVAAGAVTSQSATSGADGSDWLESSAVVAAASRRRKQILRRIRKRTLLDGLTDDSSSNNSSADEVATPKQELPQSSAGLDIGCEASCSSSTSASFHSMIEKVIPKSATNNSDLCSSTIGFNAEAATTLPASANFSKPVVIENRFLPDSNIVHDGNNTDDSATTTTKVAFAKVAHRDSHARRHYRSSQLHAPD